MLLLGSGTQGLGVLGELGNISSIFPQDEAATIPMKQLNKHPVVKLGQWLSTLMSMLMDRRSPLGSCVLFMQEQHREWM